MAGLLTDAGLAGVVLVLIAYGLITTGKVGADNPKFQLLNIVGTCGILLSLLTQWNLPAFIANVAWLVIGLFALIKHYRHKVPHA